MTSAEQAYLFRHALLRDAAYGLHMPAGRAFLHDLAFRVMETLGGGRPKPPPEPDAFGRSSLVSHPSDVWAYELGLHARLARDAGAADQEDLRQAQWLYFSRAAELEESRHHDSNAVRCWLDAAQAGSTLQRAGALRQAGAIAARTDSPAAGLPLLAQSVALFQEAGDPAGEGNALAAMAGAEREAGQVGPSEAHYRQALELAVLVGNPLHEAGALSGLASLMTVTGRRHQAESAFHKSLEINRRFGFRRSGGVNLINLATLYVDENRPREAEQLTRQALGIFRETCDRRSEGVVLTNLASLLRETGRPDEAAQAFETALVIHHEVGNRRSEGITAGNMARLKMHEQAFRAAEELFQQALSVHREVGNRRFEAAHSCDYALCLLALGRNAEAHDVWRRGAEGLAAIEDLNELRAKTAEMRVACTATGTSPFDR